MKLTLIFLLFAPFLAYGQLKTATANPLTGEVLVISGEKQTKLEPNHWLKMNDLLVSGEESLFQISLGLSSFESRGETSIQVLSSLELELQKGCLIGSFRPEVKVAKNEVHILSDRTSRGLICFSQSKLFVIVFDGELKLKSNNNELGTVQKENYRVYSFENNKLSQEKMLSPIQFQELQGRAVAQEVLNLLSIVPYGLSGDDIVNHNEVLLEEMAQLDSSIKKVKFEKSVEKKGGDFIDFKRGKILDPPFKSYYDSHTGMNYFIPEDEIPLPVQQSSRPYFFRESFRSEVTGGVRGLFDPQRLNGGSP